MLGIRYIRTQPTTHLMEYRFGRLVREGAGLAFFYFSPFTELVAVPLASTETPFIFEETAQDFQTLTVQGQVSWRINDPQRLAGLMNFTLAPRGGYATEDPARLDQKIVNLVKVCARAEIQKLPLRKAIRQTDEIAPRIRAALTANEDITTLGLEILGFAILAIKPNPETARALEAEAREELMQEADEAIYTRRNAAVEQERAIKENELNTDIAIENKKRLIREAQMDADRAIQEKRHQLEQEDMVAKTALEEQRRQHVGLATDNARLEAETQAFGVEATMKALSAVDARTLQALTASGMSPAQLAAIALQELAHDAAKIGQLNITPDLLGALLGQTGRPHA